MWRALVVLLLVGCGSSEGPAGVGRERAIQLADSAWSSGEDSSGCTRAIWFMDKESYAFGIACAIEGDSWHSGYIEYGSYVVTDRQLVLNVSRASCPADQVTSSLRVDVSRTDTTLTLTDSSGAETYKRLTRSDPPVSADTVGCFDEEGYFTGAPVLPL